MKRIKYRSSKLSEYKLQKRITMTELVKKRKSLPKNKVAGIHFPMSINGKALETGFDYLFPKKQKVMSHSLKKPNAEKERNFTHGRLYEISPDGKHFYFNAPEENGSPNEIFAYCLTKRKIQHFHAKAVLNII